MSEAMENPGTEYVGTGEAAKLLGAMRITVSQQCQQGRIRAVKIANRWLIPRLVVEEMAKTYHGQRGRPRTKRRYTKRST